MRPILLQGHVRDHCVALVVCAKLILLFPTGAIVDPDQVRTHLQ